jgi:K+-transporting ATPase ATPase B chain
VKIEELADAAQLASLADETPEGRSIAALAKEKYGLRGREVADNYATFIPFSAQTRMSGVDLYDDRHGTPGGGAGPSHAPAASRATSSGNVALAARSAAAVEARPVRSIRKGAADSVRQFVMELGGKVDPAMLKVVEEISGSGGTPLLVADGARLLGAIRLKDIVKGGIKERFAQLRKMGIKTVMVTGDNPLTAAAIAAEAGVDDFIASARSRRGAN